MCNITSLCTVCRLTALCFYFFVVLLSQLKEETTNTVTVTDDEIPSWLSWKWIKTWESYASPLDQSFRSQCLFVGDDKIVPLLFISPPDIYLPGPHITVCHVCAFFQVYIQLMRGQRSNSAIRSTKWAPRAAHSAVVAQMRKLSEKVKGQVSLAGRFYHLNRSIDGGMAEGDQCAISVRMWTVFHRTDSGTSQPRRELVTFYYCGHWSYLLFLPLWPFVKHSHDSVFCFAPQMFLALFFFYHNSLHSKGQTKVFLSLGYCVMHPAVLLI